MKINSLHVANVHIIVLSKRFTHDIKTNIMEAINKKNQGKVNKAVNAYERYSKLNDLRDIADGKGENLNKHNTACENAFDKYLTYLQELPKYEQKQIEKL